MRGSLGSNLSLLFSALIYFPQSSELRGQVFEEYVTVGLCGELWGQVFEEYVTVEFGVELCGQVFEEYVAVEFGGVRRGVRQSTAGNCAGRFLRKGIFLYLRVINELYHGCHSAEISPVR